MYDTVVASLAWNHPLDETKFQSGISSARLGETGRVRMWLNPVDGYAPRVTYWRGADGLPLSGRLRAEFSIPQMANVSPFQNPTEADADHALDAVNKYLSALSPDLPDVREWRAQRIDYAWNFTVADECAAYLVMLSKLWCGSMVRHPYPDEGIVWKGHKPNTRWVKFYDKRKQQGSAALPGVLRFEVSNYRRVLPHMCGAWFGCEQTVGELVHPGRALYTMSVFWDKLGLGSEHNVDDVVLLLSMRRRYGRAAAGAFYAYTCIRAYGSATLSTHKLLSQNSYYQWKRTLTRDGYLMRSDDIAYRLKPLHLPTHPVYMMRMSLMPAHAQNLVTGYDDPAISPQKNLWNYLGDLLGLSGARPSEYLLSRWADYAVA